MARRLLTHPDAERIIGGLLTAFFGNREDVDEEAAEARRDRRPAPVETKDDGEKKKKKKKKDSSKKKRKKKEEKEEKAAAEEADSGGNAQDEAPRKGDAPDKRDDGDEGMTRLYVNLGRRDGLRAGDIARLLRDSCSLERAEIGRVRVRDKHAFVDVQTDRVDHVLSTLPGQKVDEREVVVEVAKN